MNRIDGTIRDMMELPFLVGVQDQFELLRTVRDRNKLGISQMMAQRNQANEMAISTVGENGTVPATASTPGSSAAATEEDGSIKSRCRETHTHHNYYNTAPPTPPTPPSQVVVEPFPVPPPVYPQARGVPVWMVVVLILLALSLAGVAAGAAWWLATRPTPATPTPPANVIQPGDDLHIKVIPGA
jgi:hypothetical protein